MTIHAYKNAALSALAVAALGCAASAHAAGTDYLLKIDTIDSVTSATEGKNKDVYKGWIELNSVRWADGQTAPGGVNVASGDVNGDGKDAATGRRTYEPIVIRKRIDKSTPAPPADNKVAAAGTTAPASGQATGKRQHKPLRTRAYVDGAPPPAPGNTVAAPGSDPEAVALLLPAVQKVREAAMRMSAWEGCAAGQKIEGLAIKQKTTGRMGRILDATVSSCATESVSFNFTKIEWD
jgi:type VI protein secretion system component Hcp